MRSSCRAALLFLACTLGFLTPLCLYSAGSQPDEVPRALPVVKGPPRLLVLIVFDQMRGDYLARWHSLYGTGGFRRLCTEGAWFTNCHYPYANTVTASGHASIATGCSPSEHGIIGNQWFDAVSGEQVSCVQAGRYERVPFEPAHAATPGSTPKKEKVNISPETLRAPTLADAVKETTSGKGRVLALSLKERAAVLPGGQHPDACYWFDKETGMFVTSTYYRERLHSWVAEFNRYSPADRWFGKTWNRLWPSLDYTSHSGPDNVRGEGKGFGQGKAFPHPMPGGLTKPGPKYYEAVLNSPFGNELLLDLVLRGVDADHLGQGDTPDLLTVSFSSNDTIGHCWGPDSQEVLDVTLRADRIMEKLLVHLDARVGTGRYVLVMTADHGVCPLPEVSSAKGIPADRLFPQVLEPCASAWLDEKFGNKEVPSRWINGRSEMWFYLNHKLIQQRGISAAAVEKALADWLKDQPGILTAYTRSQILSGLTAQDPFGEMVQRSFYPERSGDVGFVLKPYYVLHTKDATGTNHGTPHSYDTHVPLLVYGSSIRRGVHPEAITPQAAAGILARAVNIKPPSMAQAPLPDGLFESP